LLFNLFELKFKKNEKKFILSTTLVLASMGIVSAGDYVSKEPESDSCTVTATVKGRLNLYFVEIEVEQTATCTRETCSEARSCAYSMITN
jgi:hypothetical protein